MDRNKLITAVLACAVATGALGVTSAAFAEGERENATNEAGVIAKTKVTIAQAIATAEQHVGGKAIGTGIEEENGTAAFYVEVLKEGQKRKVIVDLQSGQVVQTFNTDNDEENDID